MSSASGPLYSKQAYTSLLKLSQGRGYKFLGFLDPREVNARTIYLRHDIDQSLAMALELAKLNAAANVRGTFFVLLRSQVYNLHSKWVLSSLHEISALGQRLAFHCSLPESMQLNDSALANAVQTDFAIVRNALPEVEPVFSWHNPPSELLSSSLELSVDGLVNVYGRQFVKDIPYYADSNMRYSVSEFEEILKQEHQVLHLLFHPCNWIAGGEDMGAVLVKTWEYVIRERELEMGGNHSYKKLFPNGLPQEVFDAFSGCWEKLAKQRKQGMAESAFD